MAAEVQIVTMLKTSCNMHDFILFLFFIAESIGKGRKAQGLKGGPRTTGGAIRPDVKKIAVVATAAVIVRNLPTAKPWTLTLMMISLQVSSKVSYILASFLTCCDNVQTAMLNRHASLALESVNE